MKKAEKKTAKKIPKAPKAPRQFGMWVLALALIVFTLQNNRSEPLQDNLKENEQLFQVQSYMNQMAEDLNEMRAYLLLPERNYGHSNNNEEAVKEDDLDSTLTQFTSELGQKNHHSDNLVAKTKLIQDLKVNAEFNQSVLNMGLVAGKALEENDALISLKFYKGNEAIAQLVFNKSELKFYAQSILGQEELVLNEQATLNASTLAYLQKNSELVSSTKLKIADQKLAIETLWDDEQISLVLQENKLQPDLTAIESEEGFVYGIKNVDSSTLLTLTINRKTAGFLLQGIEYSDLETLKEPLIKELKKLNGESERTLNIQKKESEIRALMTSEAFTANLADSHLALGEEQEEGERLLYELQKLDDKSPIGVIIFERGTGSLLYKNYADNQESSIEDLLDGSKKNS